MELPADAPLAAPADPPAAMPSSAAAAAPAAAPAGASAAVEEPPRAAVWTEKPADPATFLSAEVAPHVPELAAHAYVDGDVAAVGIPGWRAVGASRRGRLHAHQGRYREDALALASWPRGVVMAVADGAGSAPLSRVGAELATRTLAAHASDDAALARALDQGMQAAQERLVRLAEASGVARSALRCTLLAVALVDDGAGNARLASAQVGDGVVARVGRDGTVSRLGRGDSGEFSGEVSCFLPDPCAPERARASVAVGDARDVALVLVASDGIEDPFYPIERTGGLVARQLLGGVTEPAHNFQRQDPQPAPLLAADPSAALLAWLAFERRGENDDRTLAVLHPLPVPPAPATPAPPAA